MENGPFHLNVCCDRDSLDAGAALLRSFSHSGLSAHVVAAGISDGQPMIMTEAYRPVKDSWKMTQAILKIADILARSPSYSDSDIRAAIHQSDIFPAEQAPFLEKTLRHCAALARQGVVINHLTISQVVSQEYPKRPAGPEWRITGGMMRHYEGIVPAAIGASPPSRTDISGLIAYYDQAVRSGKIPANLFSMQPETDMMAAEETISRNIDILASLIPGSRYLGSGIDGFVLDIGGERIIKAWHEPDFDGAGFDLDRAGIETLAISSLKGSEAGYLMPTIDYYGFAGPFRCMVRNDLRDLDTPLVGIDEEQYMEDVLSLADRLSRPPEDQQHLEMSEDDIADELAIIIERHKIEDFDHDGSQDRHDPLTDLSFVHSMTMLYQAASKSGVILNDIANSSNFGLDDEGNLCLRDLSRCRLQSPDAERNIYPGGSILGDIIRHAARETGLVSEMVHTPKPDRSGLAYEHDDSNTRAGL